MYSVINRKKIKITIYNLLVFPPGSLTVTERKKKTQTHTASSGQRRMSSGCHRLTRLV